MRLKSLFCVVSTLLTLAIATSARAQLPDQRGETYIATGNLLVTGIAFGTDFSQVANGGVGFGKSNLARLIIDNTGLPDNSNLSGKFRLPVFQSTGFPTDAHPELPMTGSFDRSSGTFTMTGSLPSTTIIDFGVTDLGPPFGNRRIQVALESLSVTLTGTGAVTGGQFKITQVGLAPFVYPTAPPPNTRVLLCLQDPNLIIFGGFVDNVIGSSLVLRNGSFFQPAVSGTITLEGIPSLGAATQPIGPVFFQFNGVNGNQVRSVLLNNDGTYTTYVNPDVYSTIKAKNPTSLRKLVASNVNLNGNDVSGINGTLLTGDATNDNAVDITDLLLLIAHYNQVSPSAGYLIACDFNRDGTNDITDLLLLIANYNKLGD